MEEKNKMRLQKNQTSILDDLRVDDVLSELEQEGVLTDDDCERIKAEKTRRDRVLKLLHLLPYRGSKAYDTFRNALSKDDAYTWLVESLDKTDVSSLEVSLKSNIGPIKELNHKVFKRISQHVDVIAGWKGLGRACGLEESTLCQIEHACSLEGPKEMAYQSLLKWQQLNGKKCTVSELINILCSHGYKYLADELEGTE